MSSREKVYIAIDLKSFYASVECRERGLDPLTTNLVVADESRTNKTICLAVSPSLKAYGIPGRARLFEVVQSVRQINARRRSALPDRTFTGSSTDERELEADPSLELAYITAVPRMAYYMKYSARVYEVYLRHVAPEDIHVYSIDEVFIDATKYLRGGQRTAREFASLLISEVLETTGVTATAGIGTNLYLAKIAMDIQAKHIPADPNSVRIAELNERSYREKLWTHRPLTDFWRVGAGTARRLEQAGLYTMGDVARCSIGKEDEAYNEDFLYRMFGVNAELLIDHAWGWEPCTLEDIRSYVPESNSLSSGQVLMEPYPFDKARLVMEEMTDLLVMDLVEKGLVTDQIVLHLGYDIENLNDPDRRKSYRGEVTADFYGRKVPKPARGTARLDPPTSSTRKILEAAEKLFDRIADPSLLIRRITVEANHVRREENTDRERPEYEQMDLFTDYAEKQEKEKKEEEELAREKRRQQALLEIRKKYGKNAILPGRSLKEGATAKERNEQIGGHKA